jgi:hypothetical protein
MFPLHRNKAANAIAMSAGVKRLPRWALLRNSHFRGGETTVCREKNGIGKTEGGRHEIRSKAASLNDSPMKRAHTHGECLAHNEASGLRQFTVFDVIRPLQKLLSQTRRTSGRFRLH